MPRSSTLPRLQISARAGRVERLVVAGWQGRAPSGAGLDAASAAALARIWDGKRFSGGREQERALTLGRGSGVDLRLSGLGPQAEATRRGLDAWIYKVVGAARRDGVKRLAVRLPDELLAGAGALNEGRRLQLAAYRFERFRRRSGPAPALTEIQLVVPGGLAAGARRDLATTAAVVAGATLTRDLANTPPNEANPAWMAARSREIGKRHGYVVRVLEAADLRRRGMGGLLAVGGGSTNPPRLVRLERRGARRPRRPVVALVGKGVTFDTGGISIKPAAQMDEMKYDKSGACTVLGILAAAAELDLPLHLRGYLPLAENMPDGGSYRPGDIVRTYNGTTVEITNTDAEGRMILADAVAWAAAEKPDALLEFSTLTGACVVALGQSTGGLFSPDDGLAEELLAAARRAGELLWRLPVGPDYLDDMRGTHGDLRNSGSRWGGASAAASFLGEFTKAMGPKYRWAHFDIAGPAYVGHESPEPRGATGYGVATVVEWLRGYAGGAGPRS